MTVAPVAWLRIAKQRGNRTRLTDLQRPPLFRFACLSADRRNKAAGGIYPEPRLFGFLKKPNRALVAKDYLNNKIVKELSSVGKFIPPRITADGKILARGRESSPVPRLLRDEN